MGRGKSLSQKGLEFEPPIIPLFVSKTAFYLPKAAAWPR